MIQNSTMDQATHPISGSRVRLPVEERSYPQFWQDARISPGRVVTALGLGILGTVISFGGPAFVVGALNPNAVSAGRMTPASFLVNNLSLAMMIVVAMMISAVFIRQPAGFMTSVIGRMRWRWLFQCVLVLVPVWIIQRLTELFLSDETNHLEVNPNTGVMIVIILTTQVFQCAGEEYTFRGVLNRVAGSLVRGEWAGFLLGGIVSTTVFTAVHGAGDPWLNLEYFTFGMCAAWLTWRTGGLEAAIAMHCVNNLVAGASVPFSDLSEIFVREAGAGSPWALTKVAATVVTTALLTWLGDRNGLVSRSAPGASPVPQPVETTAPVLLEQSTPKPDFGA